MVAPKSLHVIRADKYCRALSYQLKVRAACCMFPAVLSTLAMRCTLDDETPLRVPVSLI